MLFFSVLIATPKDDFESSDEHGDGEKGKLEFNEPPPECTLPWIPCISPCLAPPLTLLFSAAPLTDIAQCRVEYDYQPNQPDELLIHSGDIVNLIEKQDQDWWKGELNGVIGIFPASYVLELS